MPNIPIFNNGAKLKDIRLKSLNPVIEEVTVLKSNQEKTLKQIADVASGLHDVEVIAHKNENIINQTIADIQSAEKEIRRSYNSCGIDGYDKTITFYHDSEVKEKCDLSPMFAGITEQGIIVSNDIETLPGVINKIDFPHSVISVDKVDKKKAVVTIAGGTSLDATVGDLTRKITGIKMLTDTGASFVGNELELQIPSLSVRGDVGLPTVQPEKIHFHNMKVDKKGDEITIAPLDSSLGVIVGRDGTTARPLSKISIPTDSLCVISNDVTGTSQELAIHQLRAKKVNQTASPVAIGMVVLDSDNAGFVNEAGNALHLTSKTALKVQSDSGVTVTTDHVQFEGASIQSSGDLTIIKNLGAIKVATGSGAPKGNANTISFEEDFQYELDSSKKTLKVKPMFADESGQKKNIKGFKNVPSGSVGVDGILDVTSLETTVSAKSIDNAIEHNGVDVASSVDSTTGKLKLDLNKNQFKKTLKDTLLGVDKIIADSDGIKWAAQGSDQIKASLKPTGVVKSVVNNIDESSEVKATTVNNKIKFTIEEGSTVTASCCY